MVSIKMVSIKMLSIKLLWAEEILMERRFLEEVFVEVGRCDVAFGGTACTGLCGQEISGKLITCVRTRIVWSEN